MKRFTLVALVVAVVFLIPTALAKQPKCRADLGHCPREGCSQNSDHDPDLNKLKNLKSSTKPVVDRTLTEMMEREQKVEDSGYRRGDDRAPLKDLDEGTQARVVGYLLAVKQEHGESCNCHLNKVDVTTDNHLVLVNPETVTDNPLPEPATPDELKAILELTTTPILPANFRRE